MIDFLKYRIFSFFLSVFIIASGIVGYFWFGGFKYSVDFTGGTQILLAFSKQVNSVKIKGIITSKGWEGVAIREFSPTEVLVRIKEFSGGARGQAEKLLTAVQEELSDTVVTIKQNDSVGPGAGAILRSKSLYAILFALLLMLLYIALRFQFAFAVGAVVAIFHDAFAILTSFLWLEKELSTHVIVAVLAILGYSINDTIVIFTRIRENLPKMSGASLYEIANTSINQTLRRTLLTSLSTALTVGSLFVIGGEGLRDFSLALLIGIIFGTYSSIYIASPVMLMLYRGRK